MGTSVFLTQWQNGYVQLFENQEPYLQEISYASSLKSSRQCMKSFLRRSSQRDLTEIKKMTITYLSPGSVVVKIHQRTCVLCNFPDVDEIPGKGESILDVGAAATPLPAVVGIIGQFRFVAAASAEISSAARLRNGVGDSGWDDSETKGGFPVR